MNQSLPQLNLCGGPPVLSPPQRRALATAGRALHDNAWRIGQVAIGLEDCETIAALVIVAYLDAVTEKLR